MNEKILALLKEVKPEHDFTTSSDFIEDGLLDSFDVASLSVSLGDAFGISIDGLDITPENFSSLEGIVALVKKSGGDV